MLGFAAQRFALLAGGWAWIMLIILGKAQARKMLENGADSHQSSARGVGRVLQDGLIFAFIRHYRFFKTHARSRVF